MNLFPPLFAAGWDARDVIQYVILFLIFVVPIISQLIKKVRGIPPPDQRPLPVRPDPPADVADEIEDFMHRAAQRKPIQIKRQTAAALSPVVAEPVRAEVVVERLVGKQVKTHFNEQKFSKREANLGKEVAQTGSELNQRLHQVFDHNVGNLEDAPDTAGGSSSNKPPEVAAGTSLFTSGLFDLLSNPNSLRQAIVLNEVLRRPEDRWG